jgi:hypothetical protein
MHHVGTIVKSSAILNREFHGQCSCGTAGYFTTRDEAAQYLTNHGQKLLALGPTNTFELVDNSEKPEAKPALPTAHVGGMGTLPASHAAGPPPPPPPPPSATEPPKN